jgi:hypothetical protein
MVLSGPWPARSRKVVPRFPPCSVLGFDIGCRSAPYIRVGDDDPSYACGGLIATIDARLRRADPRKAQDETPCTSAPSEDGRAPVFTGYSIREATPHQLNMVSAAWPRPRPRVSPAARYRRLPPVPIKLLHRSGAGPAAGRDHERKGISSGASKTPQCDRRTKAEVSRRSIRLPCGWESLYWS